jgi:DNA-binding transcriptional MerR regulator
MLKIGDFSKLSRVSIKTLRYYDELGLLRPAESDRFTGYRYYAYEQLSRLNRILALKDLGFSLEQIKALLDAPPSAEQLRGMLRLRQAEAQQQVEAERLRLARIDIRLRQIEQENQMTYDVVLKTLEPQTVASLRRIIPQPHHIGDLFMEVFAYLGRCGVRPAGPNGAVWHDAEHKENDWDAEAVVPIAAALPPGAGVQVVQLPAVSQAACTIHQGSYDGFDQAYAALMQWIDGNGYRIAGPTREFYLRGPGPVPVDPATFVTEIQIPVEKA